MVCSFLQLMIQAEGWQHLLLEVTHRSCSDGSSGCEQVRGRAGADEVGSAGWRLQGSLQVPAFPQPQLLAHFFLLQPLYGQVQQGLTPHESCAGEGGRKLSPELLCSCSSQYWPLLASQVAATPRLCLGMQSSESKQQKKTGVHLAQAAARCSSMGIPSLKHHKTSQKYPHPYKQHRNASPKLLLKCLLRSNFRTTDRNTTAREVE